MKLHDQDQIRSIFEEVYPDNVRSGDLSAYADMYTEDALWMPPDGIDRCGIPDIIEGFAETIADKDIDPIFTAEEIEVKGDSGYVIGVSLATIYPKNGGESEQIKYRALWLMKKDGDRWKIARQIWNKKP